MAKEDKMWIGKGLIETCGQDGHGINNCKDETEEKESRDGRVVTVLDMKSNEDL